jgi:hypothetical protein
MQHSHEDRGGCVVDMTLTLVGDALNIVAIRLHHPAPPPTRRKEHSRSFYPTPPRVTW